MDRKIVRDEYEKWKAGLSREAQDVLRDDTTDHIAYCALLAGIVIAMNHAVSLLSKEE